MKRRLLWVGDAVVSTGFARATHHVLDELQHTWDVHVLGINYDGDPHKYAYPIYPAINWRVRATHPFGLDRIVELVRNIGPDLVVLLNDVWNVPAYLEKLGQTPAIGWLAVDGKNCKGYMLNGLKLAVFWTKFAAYEASHGGYRGPCAVVPLGVDLDIYQPMDRAQAREQFGITSALKRLGLPPDAFIVGTVNRNNPRKRLDLTIAYFAEWLQTRGVNDALLFLHVAPTGDDGFDLRQLCAYYGITNRVFIPRVEIGYGVTEKSLAAVYSVFDAQITTTQGEGFGLTTFEGMACGVPQIVPKWAALEELCGDAALQVPCSTIGVTTNGINAIGGIPDREATIEALDLLYRDKDAREEYRQRGLELVAKPEYNWKNVGLSFVNVVESLY